jgi:hypothetical protein
VKLTSEAELAEAFGMPIEKLRDLRQRKHWPHVRLSRFDIRFTDAQVAEIVASHTVKPAGATTDEVARKTGLTKRSAARAS